MLQAWAKPLPGVQGLALLLLNPDAKAHEMSVPLNMLPLTGAGLNLTSTPFSVRDIWARQDLGVRGGGTGNFTMTVAGYDSAFVRLAPAA